MVTVIYEDNHIIAINKPSGQLSQGDDTGDRTMIDYAKQYIKMRYNKPGDVFLGSVHRLDRPTSGVLVFARTSKALTRLNEIIKKRKFKKQYYCIVSSRTPQPFGELRHYLQKNPKANYVTVHEENREKAKLAILQYELLAQIDGKFLLRIDLETGRPHQIRAQLSHIGCPILGDTKYGGMKDRPGMIYLHAANVSFVHPVKKEKILIQADLPDNRIWNMFDDFIGVETDYRSGS